MFARVEAADAFGGGRAPFALDEVLTEVAALPFEVANGVPGRLMATANDGETLAIYGDATNVNCFQFAKKRTRGLPPQTNGTGLADLAIPENEGLAELSHMVWFPQDQVLGVEINGYAPPVTMLRSYFESTLRQPPEDLFIGPLVNPNVVASLEAFEAISSVQLRVRRPMLEALQIEDAGLSGNFEEMMDNFGAESLEITVRGERRSREGLGNNVLGRLLRIFRSGNAPMIFDAATVTGYKDADSKQQALNLLSDKLLTAEDIPFVETGHSRHVDPARAYHAIRNAHRTLREDIQRAMAVGV